jgi:hypothetical protein
MRWPLTARVTDRFSVPGSIMAAINLSGNNTIFNRLPANAAVMIKLSNLANITIPGNGDIFVGANHWDFTTIAGGVNPHQWRVQLSFQLRTGWRATIALGPDGPNILVENEDREPVQTLTLV